MRSELAIATHVMVVSFGQSPCSHSCDVRSKRRRSISCSVDCTFLRILRRVRKQALSTDAQAVDGSGNSSNRCSLLKELLSRVMAVVTSLDQSERV